MKIEITEQIAEILEECPVIPGEHCFENCPLAGVCLEYYTGDDSENH